MLITFLMSAYNRPSSLWMSLGSLINQTVEDWECIVLLNSQCIEDMNEHFDIEESIGDPRIRVQPSLAEPGNAAWDCYWSAEWAMKQTFIPVTGTWLAFPSDDTYYCPEFIEEMTRDDSMDLVYCDALYDKRLFGKRRILSVAPFVNQIDKTSFIVKANRFIGFPDKPTGQPGPSDCDGRAVERMVKLGYRHRKVDLPLVIHN